MFLKSISLICGTARSFRNPTTIYMIVAFVCAVLCSQPHNMLSASQYHKQHSIPLPNFVLDYFHETPKHQSCEL